MKSNKPLLILIGLVLVVGMLFFNFSYRNGNQNFPESQQFDKSFNPNYTIVSVTIPEKVDFAGELVPINNFDTYESLDREILINTYWQSQTLLFLKRANRFFPIIESILKDEGVPLDFKYLAVAESGLSNVVSPAEAAGYWQFLKGTAIEYGLEVNDEVDERYHIEKSTRAAARFLKESYNIYGSWALAAASYNMGRKNVSRQIERQKSNYYYDLMLGEETGRYVYRLTAFKLIMENPENYGFFVIDEDRYKEVPYKMVTVDSSILSLPDFANTMQINYKVLKELNPWLRDNQLLNNQKKKYEIKVADPGYRIITSNIRFYPEK